VIFIVLEPGVRVIFLYLTALLTPTVIGEALEVNAPKTVE
jgi:hypothetical protein